jgi:tRNA threonylcarbamoyladenosine biosynthesis protein TsaE
MRFRLKTREDTFKWGKAFGAMLHSGDVVALIGDLGSGKTTLTQALAAGIGVTDAVTSPTFSLIQEYAGPIPLYHFDPYRLDRPEEISELGLDEYLQRDGVVVVEWADLIRPLLPEDRFEIHLDILASDALVDSHEFPRSLCIEGLGARSCEVVIHLATVSNVADLVSGIETTHAR